MESPSRMQGGGSILGVIPALDGSVYLVGHGALALRSEDAASVFSLAFQVVTWKAIALC